MNKKILVISVLIVILSLVLVAVYVMQTGQESMEVRTEALVDDAVSLIEEKGETAFSAFREQGSKWFSGDTYVFVWQTDGIRVVYPPDVTGEGENMTSLVDFEGKEIGKLFIEIALSEDGEGWIDYQWPKPDQTVPSGKKTFIKLAVIGDEKFLVGSGFYVE